MKIAILEGRETRPDLEVGICGEHGGDPDSIEWCHLIGNNYVSCSPFRVPVARLAAAHAALKFRDGAKELGKPKRSRSKATAKARKPRSRPSPVRKVARRGR